MPVLAEGLFSTLVNLQDAIRKDFGWDLENDHNSIIHLLDSLRSSGIERWADSSRNDTFESLKNILSNAEQVLIIGAAAEPSEVEYHLDGKISIIVADGAIGVFQELSPTARSKAWAALVAIVSDADGLPYITHPAAQNIPFLLHAHGDNQLAWANILSIWQSKPPPLVITHQCPEHIEGAFNPGAFTDGDRAVAIALYMRVAPENVILCGFTTENIGRWSGRTKPALKMRKLQWMAEVIRICGVDWGESR